MDHHSGTAPWRVVVPVRDPRTGKSRLGAAPELNTALAHDTVSAALTCAEIRHLVLVTDDPWWIDRELLLESRLTLVVHGEPGLNSAVAAGLRHTGLHGAGQAHPGGRCAVLLGDLPSLRPEDLALALRAARAIPRGMVSDRHGTGTTLLTGASHRAHFGPGSAARHRDAGYRELPVPRGSTLRHDVDTPQDLSDAAHRLGVSPRTRRALTLSPSTPSPFTHGPSTSIPFTQGPPAQAPLTPSADAGAGAPAAPMTAPMAAHARLASTAEVFA